MQWTWAPYFPAQHHDVVLLAELKLFDYGSADPSSALGNGNDDHADIFSG